MALLTSGHPSGRLVLGAAAIFGWIGRAILIILIP
jgi:hypothetical protein